jgi:alpha-amylase
MVHQLGFQGVLTEGVDRYLGGRPRTQLYSSMGDHKIPVLLKHAQLSDDIAFRFSDKNWPLHPLQSGTYLHWLQAYRQEEIINLFMDFETFGEHQWADTGIFDFFRHLVRDFSRGEYNRFVAPRDVLADFYRTDEHRRDINHLPVYDVPDPISWADVDRDLTAWVDNPYQRDTLRLIYQVEPLVHASQNPALIDEWGKLQTSDHFYYMCTKWAADGDVHAYFSPYDSPHEAYRRYSTVLSDFLNKIEYWS